MQALKVLCGCVILLAITILCQACDSANGPDEKGKCSVVSDTLDPINVDSAVVLSEPFVSDDYIVFNIVEYSLFTNSELVIYSRQDRRVVDRLRAGLYDADMQRILYSSSSGVEAYYFSSGLSQSLIGGYYWPTRGLDSCAILVRTVNSTHIFNICRNDLVDVLDANNVRQIDKEKFILFDEGFWLYDMATKSRKLITSEFNGWAYAPRLSDWDVSTVTNTIVVHFMGVEAGSSYDGLFEIDIESGVWHKLLGHTDGSYTPRYESDSNVLVIRSCGVLGESYILRYNRRRKCEELIFTAKMRDDGVVAYECH